MRIAAALAGLIVFLALGSSGAQAQAPRIIVVVDFGNISVDSGLIPQARLTEVLGALLQQRMPAPSRVIAGQSVRAAMRAQGYTQDDLIYPSRAAAVAQALGADWVVTGTWTQLRIISRSTLEDPPSVRHGDAFAIADVEVRVLEATSRRRLLEERFIGRWPGGDLVSLQLAATEALRDAAARIARL
jgi:hypothetical protein